MAGQLHVLLQSSIVCRAAALLAAELWMAKHLPDIGEDGLPRPLESALI